MADEFERHRDHLTGVAYRLLGGIAEAEDAVQEAWLRWRDVDQTAIDDPRAWLTTVTGRICLDVLRSARVRREAYVGSWLPEPVVRPLADVATLDPGEHVARTDEVSMALLALLERLTPEQRVAFVLHDVFDVPFDQIADTLGIRTEAARALASRGRRAVRDSGVPRHNAELAEQRRVVAAFLRACQQGDLAGLLAVLAPDVTLTGDGGGLAPSIREPVSGAERVGRFLMNLGQRANDPDVVLLPVLVNGDLGLYGAGELGGNHTAVVMAFGIADGRITAVFNQLNPEKLGHLPPLEPS
jgi:RNA polymerase sigma-70 factor (ECF subfamily)